MTGYASARGEAEGWRWVWDIRSVNGRGLDLRLRIPDWVDGLEPMLREAVRGSIARGSVTLSLRLARDEDASHVDEIDNLRLDRVLTQIKQVELAATEAHGLTLSATRAADILPLVRASAGQEEDADAKNKKLVALFKREAASLMKAFVASRADEGEKLGAILTDQIDQIEALAKDAASVVADRSEAMAETFRANVAKVLDAAEVDEARLTQELAVLAVKTDVTEELDRLAAHVAAARELLAAKEPVGRKLDFLTQEFNREANTLCSKAQFEKLTRIGLDLKAVIDQMREQVQNVE